MIKFQWVVALSVALLCTVLQAGTVHLDASTPIEIVTAGNLGNAEEALIDYVTRSLTQALRRESLDGEGEAVRLVLEARADTWQSLPSSELKALNDIDVYEVTVAAEPSPTIHIKGATALAVGFGVAQFMERCLGMMWLFPGELGIALPDATTFDLEPVTFKGRPAIASRMFSGQLYNEQAYRLKYNKYDGALGHGTHFFKAPDYFKSLRLHNLSYASHALMHTFPPDEIAKTHPEIFPIKDGKRHEAHLAKHKSGYHSWQPCYAQQATYDIAIARVKKAMEGGGQMFSLGVNDGKNILCECDYCQGIGWTKVYYQFVNRVAASVRSHYPPKMIGCLAYGAMREPPADIKLADNVLVQITSADAALYRRWSQSAQHLGGYEYLYGFWYWIPILPLDAMAENAKFYRENRINTILAEVYPLWAFDAPKLYIRSRLFWDPELDVYAALTRYCEAAFGKASEPMNRLYEHWAAKRKEEIGPEGLSWMCPMRWRGKPNPQFNSVAPADYERTDAWLHEALVLANDNADRRRIEMVRTFFDYSRTLFRMYRLRDQLVAVDEAPPLPEAIEQAAALKATRAALRKTFEAHDEWFANSSASWEKISGRRWEAGWNVEDQFDACLSVAAYDIAQSGDPARRDELKNLPTALRRFTQPGERTDFPIWVRKSHPWYVRETDHMMSAEKSVKNELTFRAAAEGEALEPGHRYVLATVTTKRPVDGKTAFVFDVDMQAREGDVNFFVQIGSNNRGRSAVNINESVGDWDERIHRRFIVEMFFMDAETGDIIPTPKGGAQGNIEIFAVWTATGEGSALSGKVAVEQVVFGERDG